MSILFEPTKVGHLELRNRFVRSATVDACADEAGLVTEKQMGLFSKLADGGAGLVVSGASYVRASGKLGMFMNSISDDLCLRGLTELASDIHHRGTRIAVQLFHAGRMATHFPGSTYGNAIGASVVADDPYFASGRSSEGTSLYHEATESELQDIIQAFGDAARRAQVAGFDAVQVHGAHGYLLSQFLSPYTNRRQDRWGGPLENRLRLHQEIYREIRAKVGESYPVLIKLGVQDGFPGGLELREGELAARILAQAGFDALEISQGVPGHGPNSSFAHTGINTVAREAYFRVPCREIKKQVAVPVMMVGGLRTFELMEEIVSVGDADLISLCRPLVREPSIINRWRDGHRERPACVSCNGCLRTIASGEPLHCVAV
jgi:2,4-dienoyl-CoA reductase-like NADH-dependent reductase (Old Yellow Enzyme family)